MFFLFALIVLGTVAAFSLAFPEADNAICHAIYKLIMGGEDYD